MKSLKSSLLIASLVLGVASPLLRAQETPPPPPAEGRGEHGERKGPRGDRLKALADYLGLTEEQKAQIGPIIKAEGEARRAIMDDKALDKDAKGTKLKALQDENRAKIRALLTPEQQKKFDEMPQRGPGGMRGGPRGEGAEGKAKKE